MLYGGRLGTSLFELGFITEERLTDALSRAHGVASVAVDAKDIQPEAIALISKAVADALRGASGQETSDQSMNRVGGRTTAAQKGPSSSGSDQAR